MKNLIFVFILIISGAFGASAQENQINWTTDFKQAQRTARETNRPLLLDFTAEWCKPCKAMDKEFWVLPEVVNAMKPFVAVKIDYDKDKSLVGRYSVSAIPFVVFADPLGNLITFRRGLSKKNLSELNQIFSEMPKDFAAVQKAYIALDLNKNDGSALLQIADFYSKSKMASLSNDFYKRALKTDMVKNDAAQKERIASTLGVNYFISGLDAQAVEYLGDYLKDYPKAANREIVLAMLAISHARLGKEKESVKYLETLKQEFPASKHTSAVNKSIEEAKIKKDKNK